MRIFAILATCLCTMLSMGCSVDQLTLTEAEIDDLTMNFEQAMEAYSELTDFTLGVALGEEDIEGYTYDAPSAENGWTATMQFTGQAIPSGVGDMTLTIQVFRDGVPIDPYAEPLTLEDLPLLLVEGAVSFEGISNEGAPLDADGTFTWSGAFDEETSRGSMTLNGSFLIGHNDYEATLDPKDFTMHFDLESGSLLEATGRIDGKVDIPNFLFDANVEVIGDGLDLVTTIDIVGNDVTVVYPLSDL